jgi:hypothetical protein
MVQSNSTDNPPTANADKPQRDSRGQFAKGNKGGPGNPFAARINQLRSLIYKCLDDKAFVALVHAMQKAADKGDVAAVKLLFEYSIGRPKDVDGEVESGPVENYEPPRYVAIAKRIKAIDPVIAGQPAAMAANSSTTSENPEPPSTHGE